MSLPVAIIPIRGYFLLLPEWIKKKRKEIGLTQEQLADMAGVGLRFIRDMEQGKASLRLDKVNEVLKLFGAQMVPGICE